jgi:hypothetical protein
MFDLTQELIKGVGYEYGLTFSNISHSLIDVFRHLIESLIFLNSEEGRDPGFAILIDEYDKPVLDCLENIELSRKNLDLLNLFFQMVNSYSPVFSFITGSSRLARSSVFSGDNNRTDISFDPSFNELCGFTEEEITGNLVRVLGSLQ